MTTLPTCHWRFPLSGDRYRCAQTRLVTPAEGVTAEHCTRCASVLGGNGRPLYCNAPPTPEQEKLARESLPVADAAAVQEASRRRPLPCIHLGPPTGETVQCQTCTAKVNVPIHSCPKHGTCTELILAYPHQLCTSCPDRQTTQRERQPIRWVSTDQLARDTLLLASQIPPDVHAIAGIPRSGLIPASILATHLHLPLYELTEEGQLRQLGHGSRGRNLGFSRPPGRILVVDDTVYGGTAINKARQALKKLGQPALFAAVYVRPERRDRVDLFAATLSSPHLLAWNLANNGPFNGFAANPIYGRGLALDFDGIICEEPPVPDADDGPILDRYRHWLSNARPILWPRSLPIRVIITARLERWRRETMAWLDRWGIRFEQLFMHPADRASERHAIAPVAEWKGDIFRESGCGIMLESDLRQAEIIHRVSGKIVVHPPSGTVLQ